MKAIVEAVVTTKKALNLTFCIAKFTLLRLIASLIQLPNQSEGKQEKNINAASISAVLHIFLPTIYQRQLPNWDSMQLPQRIPAYKQSLHFFPPQALIRPTMVH